MYDTELFQIRDVFLFLLFHSKGAIFYDLDFFVAGIFLKKLVFSKQPLFLESVLSEKDFFADFSKA